MIVEVLIVLGMSLSTVIGHATGNCTVMGILLIFVAALHLLLVAYYRPDQESILRVLSPVVDVAQIVLLVCALAKVETDVVVNLAFVLVILQMFDCVLNK